MLIYNKIIDGCILDVFFVFHSLHFVFQPTSIKAKFIRLKIINKVQVEKFNERHNFILWCVKIYILHIWCGLSKALKDRTPRNMLLHFLTFHLVCGITCNFSSCSNSNCIALSIANVSFRYVLGGLRMKCNSNSIVLKIKVDEILYHLCYFFYGWCCIENFNANNVSLRMKK